MMSLKKMGGFEKKTLSQQEVVRNYAVLLRGIYSYGLPLFEEYDFSIYVSYSLRFDFFLEGRECVELVKVVSSVVFLALLSKQPAVAHIAFVLRELGSEQVLNLAGRPYRADAEIDFVVVVFSR